MGILNYDFKFIFWLFGLEIFLMLIIDSVMEAVVAISRGITINELKRSWNYRYLFQMTDFGVEGDEN